MNKKIITFLIIAFSILIIFTACTEIDPLGVANGVPEGYDPDAVVYDNDWIYFAEGNTSIKKMRLNGDDIVEVFTVNYGGSVEIKKIQLDPVRQKIYIFAQELAVSNRIHEYNLDGSGEQIVTEFLDVFDISDMTIDHVNGYLYYTIEEIPGISRVVLGTDPVDVESVYNTALSSDSYVTPDYKGGVYYLYNSSFNKVNISGGSDPFATVPAPSSVSGGLCYDSANDFLYFYDMDMIYKIEIADPNADYSAVYDGAWDVGGSLVLYQTDRKIYYFVNEGASEYIYTVSMDGIGTQTTTIILSRAPGTINAFDILAK